MHVVISRVKILDSRDPKIQLNDPKSYVKDEIKIFLEGKKGFKFQITLVVAFKKELNIDETKHLNNYFNSNAEFFINDFNIDETPELSYQVKLTRIHN